MRSATLFLHGVMVNLQTDMLRVTPTVGVIIVCVIAMRAIVVAPAKFPPWSVFLVNFMSVTISYYAIFCILVK